MSVNPVILVHGTQGSWLKDEYPVDYNNDVLWTGILKKNFDTLHLHELDATVDAQVKRWVMPHQAVPLIYEGIVDEIRDEMDEQSYAYVFAYDWRKDNRLAAQALSEFIDRVLRVAGVHEKKVGRSAPRQVVLLGHSMGGLVIKWCATQIVSARKIVKIITIATPFRGSLKAVEALLPGARNLFGFENKKSMRHASRTLPGVYQLLPTWNNAIVDSRSGQELKPFNVSSWQKSLVDNLSKRFSPHFLPDKLADARAFTRVINKPWPQQLVKKVYYAHGTGSDTWKQVAVDTRQGNFYLFKDAASDDEGDGTVHSLSSHQPEITGRNRVHLDQKHFFRDQLAGQHANMPNHSGLQDWILGVLRVNPHAAHSYESPL